MTNTEPFLGVIVDTDGVLTATAQLHRQAWQHMFDEFLKAQPGQTPFSQSDYLTHLDGKPRYQGVADFLVSRGLSLPFGSPSDEPDTNTICGLGNRKNAVFLNLVETNGIQALPGGALPGGALPGGALPGGALPGGALPGVRATLVRWRRGGLKLGVISASRNCRMILDAADLTRHVDIIVDGQDAAEQALKDKRAIMLHAAGKLDLDPARAVVVEDATNGIRAARDGGFGLAVGIARGNSEQQLRDAGAHVVAPGLAHVRFERRLPHALERWGELVKLRKQLRLAVFLDFDGTLAAIVDDPNDAHMTQQMRAAVKALSERTTVSIVSGRDRADVEARVNIDGLVYAGNHGLDIVAGDLRKTQPQAEQAVTSIEQARRDLDRRLGTLPGVIIEEKRLSVGVHYRKVQEASIVNQVQEVVDDVSRTTGLRCRKGKRVFELEPNVEWDKGRALNWLLDSLPMLDAEETFIVYIGDDETDEDAFAMLDGRGVGIRVGDAVADSLADYYVTAQDEVVTVLERLRIEAG